MANLNPITTGSSQISSLTFNKSSEYLHDESIDRIHSHPDSITSHYSVARSNSQESQPVSVPKKSTSIINNVISKIPSPSSTDNLLSTILKKTGIKSSERHDSHYGPTTKSLDYHVVDEEDILFENLSIPEILATGLPMLRITRRKRVLRSFKIDLEKALLTWNNKSTSRLSLDKIQQIRVASDAKNYREEYGVSNEFNDRWITIVYNDLVSNKLKTLHIIATTSQDFELFTKSLIKLVKRRKELMKILSIPSEGNLVIPWKDFVSKDDEKESLSFKEVLTLLKKLHIYCDENYLGSIFDQFQVGSYLNFKDFEKFVKVLKARPEVESIFKEITDGLNIMTLTQFIHFVQKTQREEETTKIETITGTFNKISKDNVITLDIFTNFLKASPIYLDLNQDMTRPLNEYYISSSHNTYLIGKQYGGSASIEGYIKSLQRGCRSIEIDIWDGDDGPVVSHGKLTSSIPVKDVFEAVKKYAFIVSAFPLFLSFEIHCRVEYQYIVRDSLFEIFGDLLVVKNLKENESKLPSPEVLKGKILVKFKKVGLFDETNGHDNTDISLSSSGICDDKTLTTTTTTTTPGTTTSTSEDLSLIKLRIAKAKKNSVKIIPELYSLSVYSQGLKFRNFSLPESKKMHHIFSFSENSFNSTIKDHEKEYLLMKHNRRFLMRLYPSGFRYTSKNFMPVKFWNYGVQMAATNWQTYDLGQQVNESLFNSVNKIGYYHKHANLRNANSQIKFKYFSSEFTFIRFQITVISAQYLPKPSDMKQLNPNVTFQLIETQLLTDLTVTNLTTNQTTVTSNSSYTTQTIPSNGFNPVWNHRISGLIRNENDLNFFRFIIKSDDTSIATNCFNLTGLRKGYRHFPLYDMNGEEYILSSLFVKVEYDIVR